MKSIASHKWAVYAFLGLASAVLCAGAFALSFVATWTTHWLVAIPGLLFLLAVPQVTLHLLAKVRDFAQHPHWLHGIVYLLSGTLLSLLLFWGLAEAAQQTGNRIPVQAFWSLYSVLIGLIGFALLILYGRFMGDR